MREITEEARDAKKADAGVFDTKARIISIVVLVLMLLTIWYMLTIVLLTFILTFIFYHLLAAVRKRLNRLLPFRLPDGALLAILYLLFFFLLTIGSIDFATKLAAQIMDIARIFMNFDFDAVRDSLDPRLAELLLNVDITPYFAEAGRQMLYGVGRFGGFSVNLLLGILLSFLLLLEKNKIKKFGEVLERSRIAFLYKYMVNFGANFARTFAQVMKVQVTIAFINCVLSMICLSVLGFPQIMGLGIMIFLMGLIPVAGVIISLVPLSVVAFNIGGLSMVIAVIIMIVVIHAIEAYILNPKLMANKTALPMSFVFIILLVAEHYLHIWGLLIGVPLFIFLLNIFEVDYAKAFTPHEFALSKWWKKWRKGAR
jgi:predicted PurR-regulated permease PerM